MKKSMMKRTSLREIKQSLGRYLAILAIVALGVGFFAGLRVTKPSMIQTAQQFWDTHVFYDFRLVSTLGFEQKDVDTIAALDDIQSVQGVVSTDFLSENKEGIERVLTGMSITDQVNIIALEEGRFPQKADECVIDYRYTGLDIGDMVSVSKNNDTDTIEMFSYDTYTVVGKVKSPLYANFERGTTSLLDGKVAGFVYLPEDGFQTTYYTDIYLTYGSGYDIYSDAYDTLIENHKAAITNTAEQCLERRYDRIVSEAQEEIEDAQKEIEQHQQEIEDGEEALAEATSQLETQKSALESGAQASYVPIEMYQAFLKEYEDNIAILAEQEQTLQEAQDEIAQAKEELAEAQADLDEAIETMSDRKVYILGRDTNIGYMSFLNDASIVEGISNVFPIFFFLVAALVCMTTMTRMVEEQRTQIGVLKALGYGNISIMSKYLFYATSAAILGSIIGFFAGCWLFPLVIWQAYGIMYDFSSTINYLFDPTLAGVLLLVAFLCTGGATYLSCYYELTSEPSTLIRPKSPKEGKRILLERIPCIWNRLKFMQKVSIRNTFRYKKRFFMMLFGISGCTALLVTGFGIKDSISDIVGKQYTEIEKYDASINFDESLNQAEIEQFQEDTKSLLQGFCLVNMSDLDVMSEEATKSVTMIVPKEEESLTQYIDLHTAQGEQVLMPKVNEIIISDKAAKKLGVVIGDTVTLQDSDFHQLEVEIAGIMENYINNYIFMIPETYENFTKEKITYITAFVRYQDGNTNETATQDLLNAAHVSAVSVNSLMVERFGNMIKSLDAIVLLVITCAAALAFIVLYNLTNINITERVREIATIKVLGFYQNEVSHYVLRENLAMTFFGAWIGLLLGKALHAFVISQIDINSVRFPVLVKPQSYVFSFLLTLVFAMAVNLFMGRKLRAIDMAESLKAIE